MTARKFLKRASIGAFLIVATICEVGCGGAGVSTNSSSGTLSTQTINFTAPATPVTYGISPVTLTASASSSLAVTFSATGPATISGNSLTITGAGSITVTASQAGNANYSAATSISWPIVVNPAAQSITFAAPGTPVTYGAASVGLGATASSGLTVTYGITGPATLSGSTLSFTGAGTVGITASQSGTTNYTAAASVTRSVVVNPAPLTVTANSFTIAAGQSIPTFTATLSGFVNGDTAAVVSGKPTLASNPAAPSTPGIYTISVTQGTLSAANYTIAPLAFANGELTILPAADAGTTLAIPPLLIPTVDGNGVKHFTLNMQRGSTNLLPGVASTTEGFNGVWMGPTIEVNNGDQVALAINNSLGEDATVHWHGLHVAAVYDGGVFGVFSDGATYTPSFTVNQQATTLWYHPHVMGDTARAISLGLVGMFVINDNSATSAALPNNYGVNDIPLVLQSKAIANIGVVEYTTPTITPNLNFPLFLNGVNVTATPAILNTSENRLRFRLLDGSITEQVTVAMSDNSSFTMIASDGGYLAKPLTVTSVTLGPAERAEIIVDLTPSSPRTLVTTATPVIPIGEQGKVTTLVINENGSVTPPALPATLNTITPFNLASAVTRTVTLTPTNGVFGIDGVDVLQLSQFAQTAIHATLGNIEVWNIVNQTGAGHFFHMHDVEFQILSINGAPPPAPQAGWKDTVPIPPNATVQIAMQFLDYSSSTIAYMLHCHIVTHEDEGMMAIFYVDPVQ